MKRRAEKPRFSHVIGEWVVSVHYTYDPGETPTVVHATNSFPTEDEAAAFQAEINGGMQ